MDFASIAKFRKDISIKEHSAGKIILKFNPSLITNPELAALLKNAPKKPACIHKTSINIFTQTVSIEYDDEIIPKKLLDKLLTAKTEKTIAKTLQALHERMDEA